MHAGDGQQAHSPVFLGSTHWGSLKRKELLLGISVSPSLVFAQRRNYGRFSSREQLLKDLELVVLNPSAAVLILILQVQLIDSNNLKKLIK